MTKLQKKDKSPPHRPRHSTASNQTRMNAVRLTPAEIRAANNGGLSKSPLHKDARQSMHSFTDEHVTPPPSPTKRESTAYEAQLSNGTTQHPPTPPRSPGLRYSKTLPLAHNGIAHPHRASMPADGYSGIVGTRGDNSRTSSISSSIRAPVKYRGHEITRTGSMSMFQNPQPDIIMNPLSNFSRPRNKYSPPGSFNRESTSDETFNNRPMHQHNTSMTPSTISSFYDLGDSAGARSDSPVSVRTIESRASRHFTIINEDSLPKEIQREDEKEAEKEEGKNTPTAKPQAEIFTGKPRTQSQAVRPVKKTTSAFFDRGKDKDVQAEKKMRRHSFSWKRLSHIDLKKEPATLETAKEEISEETPDPVTVAAETTSEKTHEKVAESTTEQTSEKTAADTSSALVVTDKGKERAHDHAKPVIGVKCCDKCGRIKKLNGQHLPSSEKQGGALIIAGPSSYKLIDPEIPPMSLANPAGAANAAQLIMHRQRRPRQDQPAPNIASVVKDFADTRVPKLIRTVDPPPRITRFASLHGVPQPEVKEAAKAVQVAPVATATVASAVGVAPGPVAAAPSLPLATAATTESTESILQPVEEKKTVPLSINTQVQAPDPEEVIQMKAASTPLDEPMPEFVYDPTEDDEEELVQPKLRQRYSFDSSARSFIGPPPPAEEEAVAAAEVPPATATRPPPETLDLSKPISLPGPNLGLKFSRSSLTLKGFVLPRGKSSKDLLDVFVKDGIKVNSGVREKEVSRAAEIMAV